MSKRITTTLCDSSALPNRTACAGNATRTQQQVPPAKTLQRTWDSLVAEGKMLNAAKCQCFLLAQHNTGGPLASRAWPSTGESQCQEGCKATPLSQAFRFVEFLHCCLGQVLIPTLFLLDLYYKISAYPLNCHSRISESFRLNS